MKRTGTSLSLSENEMDSDIEVDLTLAIREHQNFKTRSTPQTPVNNMLRSMAHIDNIDGYLQQNNANTPHIPAKSLENLSSKWNNSKQLNVDDNENGNTAGSGSDISKINTTEDNSTTTTAKTTTTTAASS